MMCLNKRLDLLDLLFILVFFTLVLSQTEVSCGVIGNGGGDVEGSNFKLSGTLGQIAPGIISGNKFSVKGGFWYEIADVVTAVEQISWEIPKEFKLEQNYPNPFNPSTTIKFEVPVRTELSLTIFDIMGREILTLVHGVYEPGKYEVVFNAKNLSSGMYFYRLVSKNFVKTKKLLLLK